MKQSISTVTKSDQVRSLDHVGPASDQVGPKQVKAELRRTPFGQVQADAIVRFYGSVKAAAYALGQVDASLMQREFRDGKFGRFDEHAKDDAKAYVANVLHEVFGTLGTREARIAQLKRSITDQLDEMEQLAVSA